jgi:hypothetical protein
MRSFFILLVPLLGLGCGDDTEAPPAPDGAGGGGIGSTATSGSGGSSVEGGTATTSGGAGASGNGPVGGVAGAGGAGGKTEAEACNDWCNVLVPPCYDASEIPECVSHCKSTFEQQRPGGCADEYLGVVTCFGTLTAADYTCLDSPATPMLNAGVCSSEIQTFSACPG